MCWPDVFEKIEGELTRRELLVGAALLTTATTAAAKPQSRTISLNHLIDLTHPLTPRYPYIPIPNTTFPFQIEPIATIEQRGVYANKWTLTEHTGTHIDAPSHFISGQPNLDAMTATDLIVPIVIIDVKEKVAKERDYGVTPDDILAWEKRHSRLPEGVAVFMNSGWDIKAGDSNDFLGIDGTGTLHFPGFTPEACHFLTRERKISGVGVDTVSFDIGPDKTYRAHKELFRAGKWGIENIANLDKIPPHGATAIIGALKVEKASGGPIRLLACW